MPTYQNHGGKSSSKIDHILISKWQSGSGICTFTLICPISLNTLPHRALMLIIENLYVQRCSTKKSMDRFKIQWHKGSIDHFQDIMQQYLDDTTETINTDIAIEYLISALQTATVAVFPVKKIITYNKAKPWNEDMKQLLESRKTGKRMAIFWLSWSS